MTVRYLVSGLVQGVGFRYFTVRRANAIGIAGWVRNLPDGRVEVVAAGDPAALTQLEVFLQAGPPGSTVANVEKSEISDDISIGNTFTIR